MGLVGVVAVKQEGRMGSTVAMGGAHRGRGGTAELREHMECYRVNKRTSRRGIVR